MGDETTIAGQDGDFIAYVAKPPSGLGSVVVCIQEIFGVNLWMRNIADDLAINSKLNFTLRHFRERINIYDDQKFDYEIRRINLK